MTTFYNMLLSTGMAVEDVSHYTGLAAVVITFFIAQLVCVAVGRLLGGK